ncbi:unnamed protein product [Aureobasidium uvarum]|uniref:Uncharacterized protein n=1 Tax=Aureobasidium uvarum TaxID=2773716 RepID=A0A9N8PNB3_9PEZI|nr:unnamed protein product [Aureobasidium uvarum]
MPKDTGKVGLAHNAKKIATMHGLLTVDEQSLEQALRASARTIAPTPIGKDRNALYASHKHQILTQFQGKWNWSKASQNWTESSIAKVLSNYLFDYNKKLGVTKTVSKKKVAKKIDSSKPNPSEPTHVVPYLNEDSLVIRTRGRPRNPFSFGSVNKRTPSPRDQLVKGLSESPFDKPTNPRIDSVLPSTEHSPIESEDLEPIPKLAETILVIRPSSSDPWNRKIVSFPLWRCQIAVNGKDAPPESLEDWRDLSYADFLRQLKAEQVLASEEMIVWGQFDQVITSDLTFAGAIQEQIQAAPDNGLAPNEATFMVVSSKSVALSPEMLIANIWSEYKMTE